MLKHTLADGESTSFRNRHRVLLLVGAVLAVVAIREPLRHFRLRTTGPETLQ
jgi:hypothetical protein